MSVTEDRTAIEELISTEEDSSAEDMTVVENRHAIKVEVPTEYVEETEPTETEKLTHVVAPNQLNIQLSEDSTKEEEPPKVSESINLFKPDLSALCSAQLIQLRTQINAVQKQLPSGIDLHVQLTQVVKHLDDLAVYLDQTTIPFTEAIITIRQAVAPMTPADFAFHINNQTGDLHVTKAFIEAFKVAFLALVTADEYDWLHIDFFNQNGRLQVSSDPPLRSYLDPAKHWTHKMALDVLGLS